MPKQEWNWAINGTCKITAVNLSTVAVNSIVLFASYREYVWFDSCEIAYDVAEEKCLVAESVVSFMISLAVSMNSHGVNWISSRQFCFMT